MTPNDVANPSDQSAESALLTRNQRRWWIGITALLGTTIFGQAVFAGLMLSGTDWAHSAHMVTALALVASSFAATLVAAITLRRVPNGAKLALVLLLLSASVFAQTAVGRSSAQGGNLMWVHVPLGIGLVGFAMRAFSAARSLGVT